MALPSSLIALDGEPCAVVLADLTQTALVGRFDPSTAARQSSAIDLREGGINLDRFRFTVAERGYADSLPFNETTLAPKQINVVNRGGVDVVELLLGCSTYSAFCAAREQLLEVPSHIRVDVMRARPEMLAPFNHTLGVNTTLETADNKLVFVVRSAANGAGAGRISIAMSENSNDADLMNGIFHPLTTALRGLEEELNLRSDDLVNLRMRDEVVAFHALIANADDAGMSVLGHAKTNLSADEVIDRQVVAQDADEASSVFAVDFTVAAVETLMTSDAKWVPWAPPAVLGAVRLRYGAQAAIDLSRRVALQFAATA